MNVHAKSIHIAASFFLPLFLTACGSQYAYHQTETDVQSIKDLSLEAFIRDKIIDGQPEVNKAILSALNPVSKVVATVHGTKSIHEKLEYRKENFIYHALFDYRYHALTKPKKDLELFCKANGGRLRAKSIDSNNLAWDFPSSSSHSISEAHRHLIGMSNHQLGDDQAGKAISKAINEESFGQFSCAKDKTDIWSVNIRPLLLVRQKGMITGDPLYEMYMGVAPTTP